MKYRFLPIILVLLFLSVVKYKKIKTSPFLVKGKVPEHSMFRHFGGMRDLKSEPKATKISAIVTVCVPFL